MFSSASATFFGFSSAFSLPPFFIYMFKIKMPINVTNLFDDIGQNVCRSHLDFLSGEHLLLSAGCPECNRVRTRVDLFRFILLHYLHKRCGLHGMKQTYSQMLVFIVHCYHIKADDFRHSQQDRNNPNQSYFNCRPRWDPDAFDSIPGYNSSVSARISGKMLRLWGLFVCDCDAFFFPFCSVKRTLQGLMLNKCICLMKYDR